MNSGTTTMLLDAYLKRLRLPAVASQYQVLARDAAEKYCTYEEYLCTLLEQWCCPGTKTVAGSESNRLLLLY